LGSVEKQHVNARIKFKQSIINKEYLNHLYLLFELYITTPPYEDNSYHKKYNKIYKALTCKTLSMPCFNYYKDLFYINTKKVIPLNIGKLLTSRGLVYWAMDDGSYDGLGGFKLSTNSYTKEEVELLINVFKNKFNIIGKLKLNLINILSDLVEKNI
jgi:hypothetical protein